MRKIAGCKDNPEELWHNFGGPDEIYDLLVEQPPRRTHGRREETLQEKVSRISRELEEIKEVLSRE